MFISHSGKVKKSFSHILSPRLPQQFIKGFTLIRCINFDEILILILILI